MTPNIHFTPPAIHGVAVVPRPAADVGNVDHDRLVRVLCAIESGNDWTKEGGALQFTRKVWHEETTLPYKLSQHKPSAVIVAKQRLARIAAVSVRFGVTPTPLLLLGAWHHGLSGSMNRVRRHKLSDYMVRAIALFDSPDFK